MLRSVQLLDKRRSIYNMNEYFVPGRSGIHVQLAKGGNVKLIDIEGKQVVDFFAISAANANEILSTGVTIDCNESLNISKGDVLYTNLYSRMLKVTDDSVGKHDLLHPCCRKEMYDHFYHNGENHPSCFENINKLLEKLGLPPYATINPFNVFMNTQIHENGKIEVLSPLSGPNDYIELEALMDLDIFIAACSVSESNCNGGKCSPIKVIVNE